MSPAEGKRLVMLAVAVAAAGTYVGARGQAGPALLLAVAMAVIVLSILAEAAPQLAASLAVTMALASWLAGGDSARVLGNFVRWTGRQLETQEQTSDR